MAPDVVRVTTAKAPGSSGILSQAVKAGNLVFVSGQLGFNMQTMQLVPGGAAKEAEQALIHLGSVLKAAGSSYDKVLKTTLFLRSMDDYQAVNEVYVKFFPTVKPARSAIGVAALPKNASFEIQAIAIAGDVNERIPLKSRL